MIFRITCVTQRIHQEIQSSVLGKHTQYLTIVPHSTALTQVQATVIISELSHGCGPLICPSASTPPLYIIFLEFLILL